MVRTFFRWFTVTIVCVLGVPALAGVTVISALIFLPLPASLPSPKPDLVSRPSTVYDDKGNQIATFQQFDQSVPIQPSDLPEILKDALVASEDKNFFHEGGVDPRGTIRAFIRDMQGKGYLQGGSTITQQYVSLAYTGKKRDLWRKLKEAILAGQLARQVPKQQVLFDYLDSVYLGDGAYGVGAASVTYFRHPVSTLTIGEAAMLVGLIPAPSRYEPRANPGLAEQRRETVLLKMYQQKYITLAQYQYWKVAEVYRATGPPLPPGAPETLVYPAQQVVTQYPYFVDYVRRYLEDQPGIGPDLLYRGGLRIQTTLNVQLENEAEAAVAKTLKGTAPNLEMSLVSIEPQTGHVRALVGGRDFAKDATNLALGGCDVEPASVTVIVKATCAQTSVPLSGGTGRQPGSAFKPFVLATALADGVLPTETIYGPSSITLPQGCVGAGCQTIHNAEPASGLFSVRQATWFSVNTVYAQLILKPQVTVERTAKMAQALGITNAWYSPQVHGVSYALGALDVSPLDMASAYGVFDNHGTRVPPTPVLLVKDANGKTIVDNTAPTGKVVLNPTVADNVTDILTGVISQPGATGVAANIGRPAAGKTGTTSSFVDAWFVGYVPTLSTSVWMGYKNTEDPKKGASMTSIYSPGRAESHGPVFGGTFPAETWADYMKQATTGVPVTNFNQPAPLAPIADALDAGLRGGINPGPQQGPVVIGPGGPYEQVPAAPAAVPPNTDPPSTEPPTPSESTTTTRPLFGNGGL